MVGRHMPGAANAMSDISAIGLDDTITLYLLKNYDRSLLPVPAQRLRAWYQDNQKTRNHAHHCLPLTMANSLGYYILSPGTFSIEWSGDVQTSAVVKVLEPSSHCTVDDHAAFGSFTIQAEFIPRTRQPGDFIYIKGIANERCCPYNCMEAMIEAWWSWARFGLVFLVNRPGKFIVRRGQPVAQMFLYRGAAGHAKLDARDFEQMPSDYHAWFAKRARPDYRKDLDYMHGKQPDGSEPVAHVRHWDTGYVDQPTQPNDQSGQFPGQSGATQVVKPDLPQS